MCIQPHLVWPTEQQNENSFVRQCPRQLELHADDEDDAYDKRDRTTGISGKGPNPLVPAIVSVVVPLLIAIGGYPHLDQRSESDCHKRQCLVHDI